MLMVPDSEPGVEGLKATSKVASVPAVSVKGRVKPDMLKAEPLTPALVIFTEFCPVFVNWIDWEFELLTLTAPKSIDDGEALRLPENPGFPANPTQPAIPSTPARTIAAAKRRAADAAPQRPERPELLCNAF